MALRFTETHLVHMKKTFLLLILLSAPLTCFATFAKFYIGGFGGMNVIGSDLGSIVGAAVGYRYSRNVRFEGEVAYRRNTYDEEHLEGKQSKSFLNGKCSI